MPRPELYRQVTLTRGTRRLVTHIENYSAVVGRRITLEGEGDAIWKVDEVHGEPVPEDTLPNPHDDVRRHRRNTGDALPKGP